MNDSIKEKYKLAPDQIKKIILSDDTNEVLFQIEETYNIPKEKRGYEFIDTAVDNILLGITRPEDFVFNLKEALGVSAEDAQKIAGEISEKIFAPVKDYLINLHKTEEDEEEEEPAVAIAPQENIEGETVSRPNPNEPQQALAFNTEPENSAPQNTAQNTEQHPRATSLLPQNPQKPHLGVSPLSGQENTDATETSAPTLVSPPTPLISIDNVLQGVAHPKDFAFSLEEILGVSIEDAQKIAEDSKEKLFIPIKNYLMELLMGMYKIGKAEGEMKISEQENTEKKLPVARPNTPQTHLGVSPLSGQENTDATETSQQKDSYLEPID
ncbi:hypothetical protein KJ973_00790 [Patescibacteria group bacterium]|nr:hypothetical protein [Patescibacteria group bacterium]MBU1519223.1 hypothetical protein [Patescibacteria group bacterium]MBU1730674.1 hypothetical protein [Patescibacteria group bacterium]MBU2009943.1 hypothetical protein [Patescibacteria group bacterium]MBU2416974.1 hypothetical protein [Patescibacteria group bacterium]